MTALRDRLRNARGREKEIALSAIPGEKLVLRELTSAQAVEIQERAASAEAEDVGTTDKLRLTASLLALCLYDTAGERVFESEEQASEILLGLPGSVFEELTTAVIEFAGVGEKPAAVKNDSSASL